MPGGNALKILEVKMLPCNEARLILVNIHKKLSSIIKMFNSVQEARKRREIIDPLTGRRMNLALQNGFSRFEQDIGCEVQENCFTALQSKTRGRGMDRPKKSDEFDNENVYKHQNDLTLKHGLKIATVMPIIPLSFSLTTLTSLAKSSDSQDSSYMQEFVKNWNNPVFGVAKDTALSAQVVGCIPVRKHVKNMNGEITISKSCLQNIQVIAQIDCKFLACKCTIVTNEMKSKNFLLLIDQHAAHERIRLENLQEEFFSFSTKPDGNFTRSVISKNLNPPVLLSLKLSQDQSLKRWRQEYEKIGIKFTIQNELCVEDKKYVTVCVNSLPSLFVVSKKAGKEMHPILEEARLKELFYEHLKVLETVPSVISITPPAINTVLSSYACHGAIKFGDRLSHQECRVLLAQLAKCKLPFQCAHGRPSIAPIIDLSSPRLPSWEDTKPKIWKLKRRNKV